MPEDASCGLIWLAEYTECCRDDDAPSVAKEHSLCFDWYIQLRSVLSNLSVSPSQSLCNRTQNPGCHIAILVLSFSLNLCT